MSGGSQIFWDWCENAPLGAGRVIIAAAAVVASLFVNLRLPLYLDVPVVAAAAVALIVGATAHVLARHALHERNERQRQWLQTVPPHGYDDFRTQLAAREEEVARARRDWLGPLVTAFVVLVSAAVVPYGLASHAPHALVDPVSTVWVALSLALGLACAVMAAVAGSRGDEEAEEYADATTGSRDG